ncbi:hypothetical protein GKS24_07690 [Streptococcus uberis]|uniref:Repressor n=1 Tax=Streptococcus uberis TaxID=1349 RepID=A0A6L6G8B6_STRUB|nr:hypothetical protein [Streptococcus uberis]MCK1234993.1 hypothetical protein [Streptococcus uberis]MTB78502.1 hypothetical protein [Streptococcus uberis]MTC85275.1 hypothetical protein [Streptococcus uberis]MTC86751.1 hypothetical protein [Streptococcus uberis]MTD01643.1 hypothetical protein [Streptococcus uberis]
MIITDNQAKAVRRKQADLMLNAKDAAAEIGITQVTYRKVSKGGEVKNTIYAKVMEWLAKGY